jgi:uncharacterized membrane protein
MTDNDNILIERLFEEASRQQIADDGFTKRVMAALPDNSAAKVRRLSRLWTWFCILVGVALFFLLNGWAVLKATLLAIFNTVLTSLSVLLTTAPTADLRLDPAVLLVLLVFVLVVLPYQTARRLSTSL